MTTRATRQTSVRLPVDLVERLEAAAAERVVGRSKLVELLLTEALDRIIPLDEVATTPAPPAFPGYRPGLSAFESRILSIPRMVDRINTSLADDETVEVDRSERAS